MDFRGLDKHRKWKATKQTPSRFSFLTSDFNDVNGKKYKEAIREIFYDNWFPDIDIDKATIDSSRITDAKSLNNCIQAFKAGEAPGKFNLLFDYTLKGLGAGEVLLFLIIDKSYIGGGSSAAIDLISPTKKFEIKSAKFNQGSKFYYDFRFGGTIQDTGIKDALLELGKKTMDGSVVMFNKNATNNSSLAIPATKMRTIAETHKEEFLQIEKDYRNVVGEYLGSTYLVVFDSSDGLIKFLNPGNSIGSKIGINRRVGGAIEPIIRV